MAEQMDVITHLSQGIGPHPAGTEEEQQAALFIADELRNSSGFSASIEDFNCISDGHEQIPSLICFGIAFVCAILAVIFPQTKLVCFFLVLIATVLYACEIFNKPLLSRLFERGVSQNIVAKYQPASANAVKRRRKVILVAGYDSTRVLREEQPPLTSAMSVIQKVCAGALVVATVLLLLGATVLAGNTGAASSVLSVLLVLCAVVFVAPLLRGALHLMAPYSDSANNNSAGVSVLLEVAHQVGNGLVSVDESEQRGKEQGTVIHGEDAAYEAGVVPDGASLEYETSAVSSAESLAAAKAAIAALTGQPVADKVPVADISSRLVQGGGLNEEDNAAASQVRFEAGTSSPTRVAKVDTTSEAALAAEALAEAVNEAAAAAQRSVAGATQASSSQAGPDNYNDEVPANESISSAEFERVPPAALQSGGGTEAFMPVDKTPAWARSAQAKARANKPSLAQQTHASRSRYADTIAAQMQDSALNAQVELAEQPAVSEPTKESLEAEANELSARLKEVHAAIASAQAPSVETLSVDEPAVIEQVVSEDASESIPDNETQSPHSTAAMPVISAGEEDEVRRYVPASMVREAPQEEEAAQPGGTEPVFALQEAENIRAVDDGEAVVESGYVGDVSAGATMVMNPVDPDVLASAPTGEMQPVGSAASEVAAEATTVMQPVTEEVIAVDAGADDNASEPAISSVDGADATSAMAPVDVSAFVANEPKKVKRRRPARRSRAQVMRSVPEVSVPEEAPQVSAQALPDEAANIPVENVDEAYAARTQNLFAYDTAAPGAPVSPDPAARSVDEVLGDAADKPAEPVMVAAPIMGMDDMQSGSFAAVSVDNLDAEIDRQVITLPDVVPVQSESGTLQQRAPMAAASESSKAGSRALLSGALPKIGDDLLAAEESHDAFGLNGPEPGSATNSQQMVSATGSFSTVGGTGSFAPVGDELVADVAPEEVYVDDADDSSFEESHTETGAFAGPGYIEMPKSRAGRLFGRFRKNKKNQPENDSVRDWVQVNEEYDARSVGKARGDWSSFSGNSADFEADTQYRADGASDSGAVKATEYPVDIAQNAFTDVDWDSDDWDNDDGWNNNRGWNGGAFSLKRFRKAKQEEPEGVLEEEFADDGFIEGEYVNGELVEEALEGTAVESAPSASPDVAQPVVINGGTAAESQPAQQPRFVNDSDEDAIDQINYELGRINEFRHPDINTEVWFVALGAEAYSHSGIRAFLAEHESEMKGAIIINLEGLGAGNLSLVEQEGSYKPYKVSARMKRFLRQATDRTGVACATASLAARTTTAGIAGNEGVQAFTLAGIENETVARYSSADDVLGNIDAETLQSSANFVMGVLKSI